jgi:thioredoxin reductase (NADPH)
MDNINHYDAIVIGAGPAGLSAGIYLSRARVKTLIINEGVAGGQMILTHEIANYPGVESISGYQLSNIMKKQAQSFGCDIMTNVSVSNLSLAGELKTVELADGTFFTSHAIILAPGGRSRTIGVTGEDDFKGRGISYCATCDGDFFTDKEIIVVGGGNSALEEAVSLTKYASKVTIVHQFDHFQAFEHAVEEAGSNPKINFIMESAVVAFYGDEKLESVDIKNLKSEEITNFKTEGAFVFIGYVPNTEFIKDKVNLNQWGEIVVKNDMSTSIEGVYAAGDSTAKRFRQVTTAVSDGTIAALASANYLNELKIRQKQQILA